MGYNHVALLGRFTKDPVLSETSSGISVATFTLAVESGFGETKKTHFINCVAWRNTAETIAKYLEKGRQILVAGELQTRSYEDKEGNKRIVTEVLVKEFYFCDTKPNGDDNSHTKAESASQGRNRTKQVALEELDGDGDLPF